MVVRNPDPLLRLRSVAPRLHRRFTLEECLRMIEADILNGDDHCELINGHLLEQPLVNPPHASAVSALTTELPLILLREWVVRGDSPILLPSSDSLPRPDFVVVPPPRSNYADRHPTPDEVLLLIEVSDTSLVEDQTTKLEIFARDKIPVYWIVNLIDRRVEVYTQPRGGKKPTYRTRTDYLPGSTVPVVPRGTEVGSIAVDEILPKSE